MAKIRVESHLIADEMNIAMKACVLARRLAGVDGYVYQDISNFLTQRDSRTRKYWSMAQTAMEVCNDTDPDDALSGLEIRHENQITDSLKASGGNEDKIKWFAGPKKKKAKPAQVYGFQPGQTVEQFDETSRAFQDVTGDMLQEIKERVEALEQLIGTEA